MANLRADNLTGTGGRNAINGSVYFGGYVDGQTSDYLSVIDHDDLDMGTGDFTFECWALSVGHKGTDGAETNYMGVFASRNYSAGGALIQVASDGQLRIIFPLSGGGYFEQSAGPSLFDEWHHIAVTRASGTVKGWVNGIEVISASHSGVGVDFALGGFADIGENGYNTYPGDYPFRGYISNLRLVKGKALYTAAFTPPTGRLQKTPETTLLCCQDSENPTQEATGKEIIGFCGLYYGKRYSNIATNGDLEDGTTTGWTNGGCGTFEVSNFSHSGSYSLHCISDGNGDNVYNTVSVNTSLRYKISAYINCVGPAGTSAKAKMKIGTSNGGNQNYESQTANAGTGWHYVEWIGIPAASTLYVSFNESSANNVNDWYVDDLRVEIWYPEETENILANPDFLDGATGWSFSSTPSGEYSISSNRLNVADTSRTNDAYATQQLFASSIKEGRYRIAMDYAMSSGGFDVGIGNQRIWSVSGSGSATWEIDAGMVNSSFRIITNQHGAGYYNNVKLFRIAEPKQTNNPIPPVGVDEGVVFEGDTKVNSLGYMYFPTGDTTQRGRGRAVFGGGDSTGQPFNNAIEYYQLQTSGMSFDFGDLTVGRNQVRAASSSTRGVFAGGRIPGNRTDVIDYVTIATTSNALDFGNLTDNRGAVAASSNSTRGVFMAGYNPGNVNFIDYITIASTGNALDFGDTLTDTHAQAGFASPTRGIMAGGFPSYNVIEYVTIASTGNATDFGDRVQTQHSVAGCSSQTRGIMGGGDSPNRDREMDYITIASTGNAITFGDLVTASTGQKGATSNQINGCFFAGWTGSAYVTDVQKVTIATLGNAVNFGSLMFGRHQIGATSDSHGGLS